MTATNVSNTFTLMKDAARIKLAVKPDPQFTLSVALYCAGCNANDATDANIVEQTLIMMKSIEGEIQHYPTVTNMRERAKILLCHAKRWPSRRYKKKTGLEINIFDFDGSKMFTDLLRWAGFQEIDLKGPSRPSYQNVHEFKKLFQANKVDPWQKTSSADVEKGETLLSNVLWYANIIF